MDPITIILIVVLAIGLVWLVMRGGISEPFRSMIIAVLVIVLLLAILRLAGLV